jgi:hypothetical protein
MIVEALITAAVTSLAPKALDLLWNRQQAPPPPQQVVHIHTHFDSYAPVVPAAPGYAPLAPVGTYGVVEQQYGLLEAGFYFTPEVELYAQAPHLLAVFVNEVTTGQTECFQVWADRDFRIELPPGTYSLVALMFSPAADSLATAPIYAAGLTTDVGRGNSHIDLDRYSIEELVDERPFGVTGADFYTQTDFLLFSRADAPDIPVMLSVA